MIEAYITKELLEELDEQYPQKCPAITDSDREIWLYAGMRALVDIIKISYQEQYKKVSEKVLK